MLYDLIIIGAGPAGITASVYAARKRMSLLVITKDIGGQTVWSGDIENYTGYQFITGPDLAAKFEEHMKKYGIALKEETAISLDKRGENIEVETDRGKYNARTVIAASGKKSRELGVPGEKEFKNKGLTYCATCDGPIFAGKDIAVIGGGNAGLDAALQLGKIAKRIYLVEASPRLTGDAIMKEKIDKDKKVTILKNTRVRGILGDKFVSGIKVKRGEKEETLSVQGIFVEIGLTPNSEFAGMLDKNKRGEIKINLYNETSIPGVFAAGDVTDVPEKQIIVAAGEGAKAALRAFRFLAHQKDI